MVSTQERTLPVFDEKITASVEIAGSGPPLVYFHGESGLRWDSFLDRLSAGHTVYAPRHPGTRIGDPDAIRALDTLWDLMLYYADLFEGLHLERPALVGHAFGGMVAAEVAATYPHLVSRLVLINPVGLWREDAPVANWMSMPPEELARATFSDPTGPVATQLLAAGQKTAPDPDSMAASIWSLACTGRFVWPIPDKGLKKRMYRITAPTLLVWGRDDGIVPVVYAEEFASRLRDARVAIVEGAGHLPQLEQTDRTVSLLEEFLA